MKFRAFIRVVLFSKVLMNTLHLMASFLSPDRKWCRKGKSLLASNRPIFV